MAMSAFSVITWITRFIGQLAPAARANRLVVTSSERPVLPYFPPACVALFSSWRLFMIRSCLIRFGLVIALVATGCTKNGPKIVAIEGVATHNGAPVPNLMIWFEPASGRPSWGISDK